MRATNKENISNATSKVRIYSLDTISLYLSDDAIWKVKFEVLPVQKLNKSFLEPYVLLSLESFQSFGFENGWKPILDFEVSVWTNSNQKSNFN